MKTDLLPPDTPPHQAGTDSAIAQDPRWLLVQRILLSSGFQRAGQLRRILEYITRAAIENPTVALHEHEIACSVLGRRETFDPSNDNIVRSQMSQLRRRLEVYFRDEAPHEPLHISIPKGGYLPHFHAALLPPTPTPLMEAAAVEAAAHPGVQPPVTRSNRPLFYVICSILAGLLCAAVLTWSWHRTQKRAVDAEKDLLKPNAFVQFLRARGSDVTIVVPDLSLMLIQKTLKTRLSSEEYNSNDFLKDRIAAVPDEDLRGLLHAIRARRLTSSNETAIAEDLRDVLARGGIEAKIRFARDMHTRDFGEGNLILIGASPSNPWTDLFASRTNFRYVQEASTEEGFVYENVAPAVGELKKYFPYQKLQGKLSSYADVALTSNLTNSGYVLLINGSDYAANEAATRYFLHGRLRGDLSALLKQDDLSYFEALLSGSHADNEAEEKFDLLALRPLPVR